MGKQGSPKSPRPGSLSRDESSGMKEGEQRWTEMLQNSDLSLGRRLSGATDYNWDKAMLVKAFKNDSAKYSASKGVSCAGIGRRHFRRHVRSIIFTFALMAFFFLLDSFIFSLFDPTFLKNSATTPGKAHAPKVHIDLLDVKQACLL